MRRSSWFGYLGVPSSLALTLAGCATLADVTSPFVGCPASEIRITDDHNRWGAHNWTASCRGRQYLCGAFATGNNGHQVSCSPTQHEPVVVQRGPYDGPPPAAPASTPGDVQRATRDGVAFLRVEVALGTTHLVLAGAPARDPNRLWFVVRLPGADGEHRACATGLLLDGVARPTTLERYEYESPDEELRFVMTLDELRAMTTATRVAGRVCDAEWRLDVEARRRLTEFVARFDEEIAWQRAAAPTAPAP